MAPLPQERCVLTPAFHITGIDFAEPFEVKTSNLRNAPYEKGYVCVFVCFSTNSHQHSLKHHLPVLLEGEDSHKQFVPTMVASLWEQAKF